MSGTLGWGSFELHNETIIERYAARGHQGTAIYLDADMLLRLPMDPVAMGVKPGVVVSEHVGYLDTGLRSGLPFQFLPDETTDRLVEGAVIPKLVGRQVKHLPCDVARDAAGSIAGTAVGLDCRHAAGDHAIA